MQASIGQRIAATRRQQFIGRGTERDLLDSTLMAPDLPFSLLYLHGPGGVGKTTLLQSFIVLCDARGVPSFLLDARNIKASPDAFMDVLRTVLKLPASEDPVAFLRTVAERCVLFVDTFEMLDGMAVWLRDVLLPQISVNVLIVAAGRHPPATAWPFDSGWQAVFRAVRLQNFTQPESKAYLRQRNVPVGAHAAAFQFTHGHPLALSLLADLYAQSPHTGDLPVFSPEAAPPEVIHTLLKRFMDETPSGIKRSVLEVCALVRETNEALLDAILFPHRQDESPARSSGDAEDAGALFNWLRGLSFIASGPSGLFPHDIAREVLLADLRWRNPDWYVELHSRARLYYTRQLQQTSNAEHQKHLLYDCIFLHRDSEIVRTAFTWKEIPAIVADSPRPGDAAAIVAMVATHEGEESARIAGHWLTVQPEATLVFRDTNGSDEPIAFFSMLALHEMPATGITVDPATQTAWDFIARHGSLRSGEGATYLRFCMARDTYQQTSPLQSLLIVHALRHFLTQGHRLAYTFFCCRSTETWQSLFHYAGISRVPAEFTLDGHHYGVFGHDWRSTPLMAWIARMAEKEIDADSVYHALRKADSEARALPPTPAAPRLVLDATQFTTAVREALRDLNSPEQLGRNPLLRSRLVALPRYGTLSDTEAHVAALRAVLQSAAESLNGPNPRRQRGYRAVYHTYLAPASTQEEAAQLLDLPFSTYRRHLAEGITAVTENLWQKEIGET
ncbi:MAG: ATP-binding protein [Fibrella sp.]|nr:ATP-binding protein [Armatimonadota bacterium]